MNTFLVLLGHDLHSDSKWFDVRVSHGFPWKRYWTHFERGPCGVKDGFIYLLPTCWTWPPSLQHLPLVFPKFWLNRLCLSFLSSLFKLKSSNGSWFQKATFSKSHGRRSLPSVLLYLWPFITITSLRNRNKRYRCVLLSVPNWKWKKIQDETCHVYALVCLLETFHLS